MTHPQGFPDGDNRAEPSWLDARRDADVEARAHAVSLVRALEEHLAPGPAHGIDIGTGTGFNHTYLTALISLQIRWTVLDHDPDLLSHPAHTSASRVLAGIAELPDLLDQHQAEGSFLTCSAVLDVLRDRDLQALTRVIVGRGLPALFSLSVNGEVTIRPAQPLDDRITAAFNAHQRRDGRLGPDAAPRLGRQLPKGWLQQVQTPWRLHAVANAELLRRYLSERAEVVIDQDPELTQPVAGWLELRMRQIEQGQLTVEVGHVDQLVLPI